MDKKLRIAGIIAALAFSIFYLTFSSGSLPIPEPPSLKPENNYVETLAENLDKPRSIAVSDNRIFVTEKDGKFRYAIKPSTPLTANHQVTFTLAETTVGTQENLTAALNALP